MFLQEREVKWTDVDGAAILGKYKGKPTKATIEHFRDGASCRCVYEIMLPFMTGRLLFLFQTGLSPRQK